MHDGLKDPKLHKNYLFVIGLYLFSKIFQEKLFSGSHNLVHVWDATGSFGLRGTIDHSFGSVYSLAATRQFIIVGKFFPLLRWPLHIQQTLAPFADGLIRHFHKKAVCVMTEIVKTNDLEVSHPHNCSSST